jgi:MFS family permease
MLFGKSVSSTEQSLKLSNLDAFLYSLMVGAGESYLPAYALSIGMGEVFAGILATLPLVSGAFLQLLTPRILQRIHSHKYFVVTSAFLQALAFLPLIYYSLHRAPNFWVLFLILTLYWGAGFSAGSAWNYWMGHLVPESRSTRYFSFRSRVQQIGTLVGIIGGGVALHNNVEIGPFSSVFSLLFLVAFVSRIISTLVLSRKLFKREWSVAEKAEGLLDSWKIFWQGRHKKRFFTYLVPFQIAVFVTSPFVTPFMLTQLKMNYGQYMGAIASLFLGKIISLSVIQRAKENFDGFRVMIVGLIFMSPMPLLWAFNHDYAYILGLQLVSGMALACFEVGLSLIFFQDLKQEEKVPVVTVYNLLNSVAIIGGTFIGGELLTSFEVNPQRFWALFLIGGGLRMAFSIPLIKQSKAWKKISDEAHRKEPKAS